MRKLFLVILILGFLIVANSASAKITDNPFVAAVIKFVQDIMPIEKEMFQPEEQPEEEFVDPREVQQVQREIKDIKKELNRFIKQFKKIPNTGDDLNQINALLEELVGFETKIASGVELRDTIQEFRDAQVWEQVNRFRAKIEIPKETTQWNKEIKRLEKMLTQKKYQNLGLNLEGVKAKIEETKSTLSKVQEYYNNGDLESAMEEFDYLRQDFHPGEITSVIQRVQELTNRLKVVKDKEVRSQIQETFSEVITYFNEGEYRIAREIMDESYNEITVIISKASSVGKKKGYTKEDFLKMTNELEEKVKERAEEKGMQMQPQVPVQPQTPIESPKLPETPQTTPAPLPTP